MRLNKFLAESGICSRREADRLIEAGRVTVNGVPGEAGMQVDTEDRVLFDGSPVEKKEEILLAFYKPVGVVCTDGTKDRAVTVKEYLKLETHLFPVGRLDKDSEGLLLLTNMGDLAENIARAGMSHEKEYIVTCKHPLSGSFIDRMRRGVKITIPANRSLTGEDEVYITRNCQVTRLEETVFNIVLTEGKNRQIRRMCEALGNKVVTLKRVRIMNVELGSLKPGETRNVTGEELEKLKAAAGCR